MAVPTLQQFLERFPEQTIHAVAVVQDALQQAGEVTPERVWGDVHGTACGFYAAHVLDLRNREIGAMVGQPVSGITGNGEGLQATFYGQQYLSLRAGLPITGFAI
jgi:hypothetical protein